MGSSSPNFGVKIPKILELPPLSFIGCGYPSLGLRPPNFETRGSTVRSTVPTQYKKAVLMIISQYHSIFNRLVEMDVFTRCFHMFSISFIINFLDFMMMNLASISHFSCEDFSLWCTCFLIFVESLLCCYTPRSNKSTNPVAQLGPNPSRQRWLHLFTAI